MNPRATPVRVCTKPGVARMQAVEPSLEILVVVDKMDYLSWERGKADGLMLSEGSSPVAAGKAAIQRVKVPPYQLLVSDT